MSYDDGEVKGYVVAGDVESGDYTLFKRKEYHGGIITKQEGNNCGEAYVEGTGVLVRQFWSMYEAGMSIREMVDYWTDPETGESRFTPEQAREAVEYAHHHEEEMKAIMRDQERTKRALSEQTGQSKSDPIGFLPAGESLDVELEYDMDAF